MYAIPAGQAAWVGVLERVGVGVGQAISGSFEISRCNGTGRVKSFFSFFHILQIHLNLGGIQPSLCSFEV